MLNEYSTVAKLANTYRAISMAFHQTRFICISMDKDHLQRCKLSTTYTIVNYLKDNDRQREPEKTDQVGFPGIFLPISKSFIVFLDRP